MEAGGAFSFIVPMALMGDDQAAGVRRTLLEKTGLKGIEAFPQKDDPRGRVFPEAKLSTCVFVTGAKVTRERFRVRSHPGRYIESVSPTLQVGNSELLAFDPENCAIPSCTQDDWRLAASLVTCQNLRRMSDIAQSFQGEVNETNERSKGSLSDDSGAPVALRGANICMYAVREPSQGEEVRLDVSAFLSGKRKDAKAYAFEHRRVGFQRSSPQNNFRRIIAAPVDEGHFCLDTVSYITPQSCEEELDLILALLNSRILDWYFRLSSTNSKVNEYQFNVLPAPTISEAGKGVEWRPLLELGRWDDLAQQLCMACAGPGVMPRQVADALAAMSRRIQEIEAKRVLKSRSQRSRLAPESQPIQDAIDAVLFRCYGLSDDDARYIEQRLKEML